MGSPVSNDEQLHGPELLAPAGGPDSLRAAVAAGADAVYLGLGSLNARRGAENFDLGSLRSACELAHLHGVRVYLTANVVVLPSEMPEAVELVASAYEAGIDAVIVQDIGLIRELRTQLPALRIHASTQIDTHNSATVAALLRRGVSRITLARETSLAELARFADIAAEHGGEVESFVHGALCVCYSGQCLLSSLVGGRSANRGRCAQPCRLPYELRHAGDRVNTVSGDHLLSPKDLAAITVLPQLIASGVRALKIEGRMKGPDYVAVVTGVYRQAIDRAVADPDGFRATAAELSMLEESFSRGFSEAYLVGERGNDLMSYSRPNNRGVFVGRVVSVERGWASLSLETSLDAEDTIEIWTSRGRSAQEVGAMRFDGGEHRTAPSGKVVEIALEGGVRTGDRVFRVRNASLARAAERLWAPDSERLTLPIDFRVSVVTGRPLEVVATDARGVSGRADGALVEPARTKPITADEVIEHVGRLGGTPFRAGTFDLEVSPGAGLGYSSLHHVRREALDAYLDTALAEWRGRDASVHVAQLAERRVASGEPVLVVALAGPEAVRGVLEAGASEAHVPAARLAGESVLSSVVPVLGRISHDPEFATEFEVARRYGRACAGTLGALVACVEAGVEVQAHWSLGVANAHAVAELAEVGAKRVWLSPELSGVQLARVARRSRIDVGYAVAGRQEVMVTEHCVLMSEGPCNQNCGSCKRREGERVLRDRKGYEFPVVTDGYGRTHIYNSVPLDLAPALQDIISAGVAAVRADAETLATRDAVREVARVAAALRAAHAGRPQVKLPQTTSGHFYRGVD